MGNGGTSSGVEFHTEGKFSLGEELEAHTEEKSVLVNSTRVYGPKSFGPGMKGLSRYEFVKRQS